MDSDCCAFVATIFGMPENTTSRNYKIENKRLCLSMKELVENVSIWSQVLQSIMVGSVQGIVV